MNACVLTLLIVAVLAGCAGMKGPCTRTTTTVTQCEEGGSIGGVRGGPPVIVK